MNIIRSVKSKIFNILIVLMVTLLIFWLLASANIIPHLVSVAWNEPLM